MRRFFALCALGAALLWSAPARAGLDDVDLTRGLRLLPSAQLDDPLSFLPKGDLGGDPVVWPIAVGQFVASAAINVGATYAFNQAAVSPDGAAPDAARKRVIGLGVAQVLSLPLVSATAVYFIGRLDDFRDPAFGWPLLANYVAELALVGLKLGLSLGALKGEEAAALTQSVFGKLAPVDYILHAILPPATVTYFSIRSRGPKGIGLAAREPLPVVVPPPSCSAADARAAAQAAPAPFFAALPLAGGRF